MNNRSRMRDRALKMIQMEHFRRLRAAKKKIKIRIQADFTGIIEALKTLCETMLELGYTAKKSCISSPSLAMGESGMYFAEGFAEGVRKTKEEA